MQQPNEYFFSEQHYTSSVVVKQVALGLYHQKRGK